MVTRGLSPARTPSTILPVYPPCPCPLGSSHSQRLGCKKQSIAEHPPLQSRPFATENNLGGKKPHKQRACRASLSTKHRDLCSVSLGGQDRAGEGSVAALRAMLGPSSGHSCCQQVTAPAGSAGRAVSSTGGRGEPCLREAGAVQAPLDTNIDSSRGRAGAQRQRQPSASTGTWGCACRRRCRSLGPGDAAESPLLVGLTR